jgi:hypothetical protein
MQCLRISDGMGKAGDGQQGSVVKVLDKSLMVDGSTHEYDLEKLVSGQKFLELKEQEIPVNRSFMDLAAEQPQCFVLQARALDLPHLQ